jgi:hypothetical protein
MSKKNSNHKIVRKLGEREEIIVHTLTGGELAEVQDTVMALLDHRQEVEEKKKEANANFKAQLETIELELETARRTFRGRARKESVVIEEHLTSANEVIRIRKGTKEIVGQRTATAEELQEEMFPEEQGDSGEVPQDEAPAQVDPQSDEQFDFGSEPQ